MKFDAAAYHDIINLTRFHICRIQLQKKKSGVKKRLEICAIKGGLLAGLVYTLCAKFPYGQVKYCVLD